MMDKNKGKLINKIVKIQVDSDELMGDYITIKKNGNPDRDSIMIKVVGDEGYTLGELVITDKMKVFYNHKKRGQKSSK